VQLAHVRGVALGRGVFLMLVRPHGLVRARAGSQSLALSFLVVFGAVDVVMLVRLLRGAA
jgi:hypothetical protein